tara:strand:+ start:555 stop:1784 length:1230 start_codon:yes stop_codon:yes gene_type:complete
MKLLITGASGFIGSQLVPLLGDMGHDLLLAGRSLDKMRRSFPNQNICDYDNLEVKSFEYDAVIHLAVINNSAKVDVETFRDVNVEFVKKIAEDAVKAKIPHFINISSTHSQIDNKKDHYSVSKRDGELALKAIGLPSVSNFCVPAVYGNIFRGKLFFLHYIPKFFRTTAFEFFASMRPTLSVEKLASAIDAELMLLNVSQPDPVPQFRNIYLADTQNANRLFLAQKRFIDLAVAITLLLLLSWLMFIIFSMIWLSSPGPAIFSQQRIGKDKEKFTCYKFRTMSVSTPDQPTHLTSDAHLTRIGSFLRRSKLDELPQLFNILLNEMSLVGPRPCLPSQKLLVNERSLKSVFTVKPGITGLAQIQGIDMSDPAKLAVEDGKYVAFQTLPGDLVIVIKTLLGNGQGDRLIKR